MGFKIDEIVHPDDRAKAKEFECAICMCVLCLPVETDCGHMFCQDCLDGHPSEWCPLCRSPFPTSGKRYKECNKFVLRMMQGIKVGMV